MSEVTSPLALDETLQQVVAKLGTISFSEVTGQPGNDGSDGKSAYESAQDGGFTGTEAEFNSEISKMPTVIRPNLLINPYFVGGGSQQGGGQFPINQKGQTTYSGGNTYAFDSWKIISTGPQVELIPTGMKVTISSSATVSNLVNQLLENVGSIAGKKCTLSFLLVENTTTKGVALRIGAAQPATMIGTGLLSFTVNSYSTTGTGVGFAAVDRNTDNGKYFVVAAMKLELGDTQTLAHNEGTDANPVWVLNEIPNFTEELWKCQRYYQLFASSSYRPTYGEDCRPPMATHNPSKGTIAIGGTTYYYSDSTSALT